MTAWPAFWDNGAPAWPADVERSITTVLQIAVLVGAIVRLLVVVLIVVWVRGMSRNAAVDDEKLRRDLAKEKTKAGRNTAAKADRTSA